MRQIIPPQQSVGDFASFSQIIKHVHAKILTAVSDHQELRVSVIELKKIVPPSGPSLICLSFRIAALQISSGIDKPLLVNHRHMPMQPEQNLCPAVVDLRDIIEKAVYFIDIINDCRQNRIAHALIEHMSREIVSVVALRQPLEYLNHGIDDQAFVLGGYDLAQNSACADTWHSFQASVLDMDQIEAAPASSTGLVSTI
jgi:hypothetical protein